MQSLCNKKTIATEGRQSLLGTLVGKAEATEGPDKPHVVLSPLGEKVKVEWFGISRYYHQIEAPVRDKIRTMRVD